MTRATVPRWLSALEALRPCPETVEWCRGLPARTSLAAAWRRCDRGEWLLWLVVRTLDAPPWGEERKPLVRAVARCARLALPVYEARHPGDGRVRRCLDLAEAWTRGEATPEQVVQAYVATFAAASICPPASANADAVAVLSVFALAGDDTADAFIAGFAATSIATAIASAAASPSVYASTIICSIRPRVLRECAEIVRGVFPTPPPHVYQALGMRAPRPRGAP
ncbi:MAG: hypothetical protein QME96_13465 [Myxococcota bacterium]|nr:hypothetical protein [Myxococcota bacterium]